VGRLLSLRPLVFVGLISYSLYLWHWPIFTFTRQYLDRPLLPLETGMMLLASLVVASLSWRFVEQPFRSRHRFGRKGIFALAGGAALALASLSFAIYASHGLPQRLAPQVRQFAAGMTDFSPVRERCHREKGSGRPVADSCVHGAAVTPHYAVWGDSHGVEPAAMLGELAARQGDSLLHLTYSACPPALGYDVRGRPGCAAFNRRAFAHLAATPAIHTVFLFARYDGEHFRRDLDFRRGIVRAATGLARAGKRVVLVGPVPGYDFNVPKRLATHALRGRPLPDGMPAADFVQRNRDAFDLLGRLSGPNFLHIYPHRRICDRMCRLVADGRPLYFDSHHLSVAGARHLAPLFEPVFRRAAGGAHRGADNRIASRGSPSQ
jgi:hypothetical protein